MSTRTFRSLSPLTGIPHINSFLTKKGVCSIVLNRKGMCWIETYMLVSVPFRGLWFLTEEREKLAYYKDLNGFRPLTGIEVINSTPYQWLNYAIENGLCGADFIFRLFSSFSLKLAFKNSQRPPFHHIGAEWYKIHGYVYIIPYFQKKSPKIYQIVKRLAL